MTEIVDTVQPTKEDIFKKFIPFITVTCCLASIILFIGINLEGKLDSWDVYKKWGSPSSTDIFEGSYWGLITSNFLHIELWHIALNLYWFWIFGKKIEFESNKFFYGILILSSGLVSSLSELSFGDTTGIGLSGIGYALFGFTFIKSKTSENYKDYLDKRTIMLFIFWLVLCVVLTQVEAANIGNAAHVGGFLWGMTLAYISKFENYKQAFIGIGLLFLLASSIFWNPFSTSWLSYQAYEFHKDQKIEEAIAIYKKILNRDSNNEFAKSNLRQLEIHKLQEKALELYYNQKYKEVRQICNQILSIDPNDQWAKDYLKLLPNG
jgi:GlpG protein